MELCSRSNPNESSEAEKENECELENITFHSVVASLNCTLQLADSSYSSYGSIYRVPEPLRSMKPEAYIPTVISIGPFHASRKDLMANSVKPMFLKKFLDLAKVSMDTMVETVENLEERTRRCYTESIKMNKDKFVELLVLDGCFVVMHIISSQYVEFLASNITDLWKFWHEIYYDLLLLENQLPLFLLQSIYHLCASSQLLLQDVSFMETARHFFILSSQEGLFSLPKHVLPADIGDNVNHFVDLQRMHFTQSYSDETSFKHTFWPPTATELHECGIIFRTGKGIAFKDQSGYLELPHINIFDDFEKRVKNIIAYEQCHGAVNIRNEVSNFAMFMQYLVQTDQDVKLLIEGGIIENNLGSIKEVTQLFNDLSKHVDPGINSYKSECKRMKEYCKRRRHRWMTSFRRNYCSTPWICASTTAAILLLALTFIQTVVAVVALFERGS